MILNLIPVLLMSGALIIGAIKKSEITIPLVLMSWAYVMFL